MDLAAVATTGNVSGVVRTSGTLTPVAGATVTYYNAEGEEVQSATVAANGSYSLTTLAAGNYKVVVRGTGVETYSTTQKVDAGDQLTAVNYNLTKGGTGSLEVTVVDSEGKPVNVNAGGFDLSDVFVDPTSPTVGAWEKAGTASDTVTFTGLSTGTYNLAIDAESADFVDVNTTATVAAGVPTKLKVVVDEVAAQSKVNFRVINESNVNVNGGQAVVFKEDGTVKEIHEITDGTAPLALVDGNYTLAIYNNGYIVSKSEVKVAGEEVTVPAIQLTPAK